MIERIKSIIAQGEGLKVEFKEAVNNLPSNLYDTICSFLNSQGGDVFLGIKDSGEIVGVNKGSLKNLQQAFASAMNNSQIINPPFCLELTPYEIEEKIILHTFVPESSQVHRFKDRIYIRKFDSDLDITNNQADVFKLYQLKNSSYSENKIFPAVTIEDLRVDLIEKARKIATIRNADHPWVSMDNESLLKRTGLYQKDLVTGQEGYTLACVLLFGKDETIQSAVPAFKIDLIKKVENTERYDDREVLQTNLIEAYEKAMAFVEKHLPSPFYLQKDIRVDLRSIIFREIIANAIVHKEYSGAEPTKFVIEKDKICNRERQNLYRK